MTRRLVILAVVAAGLALLFSRVSIERTKESVDAKLSGVENADYRVGAIFDTAKGVLPGQLVKIAGARAGTITKVSLTPDYKARIDMRIDRRFEPFRADASCAIRPEGLIGERFIQCSPGTPKARALRAQGDGEPTVPVEHTTLPVDLTELFRIFNSPARDRFGVVVSTLGLGTAGRGEDINAILRRANPTLASTRRLLGVIDGQRRALQQTISDGRTVLDELARRRGRVADFLDQAARVSGQTADHSTQLADSIRRLPGMLDQAQPALGQLHGLAQQSSPVLDDLQAAAPGLRRLTDRVQPLAEAASPVVDDLTKMAPRARTVVREAAPAVRQLKRFATAALPAGSGLAQLTTNLRDQGFVENLLKMLYNQAASQGRFDSIGHLSPTQLMVFAASGCSFYAKVATPECDARYHPVTKEPATRSRRPKAQHKAPAVSAPSAPSVKPPEKPKLPSLPKPPPLPKLPPVPKLPPLPKLPPVPQVPTTTAPKSPPLPDLPDLPKVGTRGSSRSVERLLDYLLR